MGVESGQHVRLTTLLPYVSQLSRKCGSLDLSQPYGFSLPVTGIALPFYFYLSVSLFPFSKILQFFIYSFHSVTILLVQSTPALQVKQTTQLLLFIVAFCRTSLHSGHGTRCKSVPDVRNAIFYTLVLWERSTPIHSISSHHARKQARIRATCTELQVGLKHANNTETHT
jgi:prepilin signal peptidase PulO-like enzyme (type II secretory pathway)